MNFPDTLDGDSAAKDSNTDLEAALLVLIVLCTAVTAVRSVPGLQYLNNLFDPLIYNTIWGLGALTAGRFFARYGARENPRQARPLHRLSASSNTALFFGLVALAAAVGLVVSAMPWDQQLLPLWIGAGQALPIALIVAMQSRFKGKPVTVPVERSARVLAHQRRGRRQLQLLAGALVVVLAVLVGGEGLVAHFTPWKTYPVHTDPNEELPYVSRLEDGSLVKMFPGTEVRARITPTRREVELVQGLAKFQIDKFPSNSHVPPFNVRAGDTLVSVLPSSWGDMNNVQDLVIRRDGRNIEILPGYEANVNLVMPTESRWASWMGSKELRFLMPRSVVRVVNAQVETDYLTEQEKEEDQLAWMGYTLKFQGESLEEAVVKVNRFASPRLVIDDPRLVDLSVHARIAFRYPNLADQFVLELERQHQARRIRETADGTIRLVAFTADPVRFGSAQAQLNEDICASYRRNHERGSLIFDPTDPDRKARFDLVSCDLKTALAAFAQQSGFQYSIAAEPRRPTLTRPLKGRYSAKTALGVMLAGTGCRASGEVLEGLKIACSGS